MTVFSLFSKLSVLRSFVKSNIILIVKGQTCMTMLIAKILQWRRFVIHIITFLESNAECLRSTSDGDSFFF